MGPAVAGLMLITSDLWQFKCRPNSDPHTLHRSWLMSSSVPPTEPSSRYHTLSFDLNWEQRSCMDRQKGRDPADLSVVLPLQTEVCCHAKTGRKVRNRKSRQRVTRLEPTHAWPAASCPCAKSWNRSWSPTSWSSGCHQGHRHTSERHALLFLHPPWCQTRAAVVPGGRSALPSPCLQQS